MVSPGGGRVLQGTHGNLTTVFLHTLGGALGPAGDQDPNVLDGV